jgi:hypothetical protein
MRKLYGKRIRVEIPWRLIISNYYYIVNFKYNTGEHKVTGIFVLVTYKIPDSCVMAK